MKNMLAIGIVKWCYNSSVVRVIGVIILSHKITQEEHNGLCHLQSCFDERQTPTRDILHPGNYRLMTPSFSKSRSQTRDPVQRQSNFRNKQMFIREHLDKEPLFSMQFPGVSSLLPGMQLGWDTLSREAWNFKGEICNNDNSS